MEESVFLKIILSIFRGLFVLKIILPIFRGFFVYKFITVGGVFCLVVVLVEPVVRCDVALSVFEK